ncbi:hypothetical protein Fcan01_18592 [Folsomia candida]|uniref:Uncharacterized protein n=1 Tax=Folsomia candida TaxID=158441 RepID=A0A226DQD3_FOLCA|nr:hypothetical protein Fcan01_18592 [Folsomia candida]
MDRVVSPLYNKWLSVFPTRYPQIASDPDPLLNRREFHVDQEQRIVQPLDGPFASLPEVREVSSSDLSSFEQDGDYFTEHEVMLTHQSRSLPPAHPIPGQRLNRTPSISSQGSQLDYAVLKGHRGSSPAIRTFTPEGLSTGVSPPDSPPLVYHGSRSPSPITNAKVGEGKSRITGKTSRLWDDMNRDTFIAS